MIKIAFSLCFLLGSAALMGSTVPNDRKCDSVLTQSLRQKNQKSLFINPPVLTAVGNQVYCPGSPMNIVTSMSITSDPGDNSTAAVYIQISSGYINGEDLLSLAGSHPNLTTTWDALAGKLTIFSPLSATVLYSDFEIAIEDVLYSSNANSPGTRTFSITIGKANYLPSSGHYYEFVPSLGIPWSTAKTAAESLTYFGLQGYLATIGAADEAKLSGEQAAGAGWIGGTDQETEGIWKWVTGPEAGTVFWNGQVNGSTPNYAFWNTSEPNNLGNENYAHITAPGVGIPGSWNDLTNQGGTSGDYQPKGYIVEYGGMPGDPVLNISTSTTITIPKINSTASAARCGNGSVTLSATAVSGTVKWYDAANGGNLLATGNSFITPSLTATTDYYVDAFEPGCTTATRTAVTAKINEIPVLTAVDPAPQCEGNITVTATSSIGQVRWFANQTDTAPLATGGSYSIQNIDQSTTLYLDAINQDCVSGPRIAMLVTIVQNPEVSDEQGSICENGTRILDAGIPNAAYQWTPGGATTKQITINDSGTYAVKITNTAGCSSTKTFTIAKKFAPVISGISVNGTTVTIVTDKPGDFEYSVDGTNFQSSNVFEVKHPGINTAYVKETNFCGDAKQEFVMIIVPSFFTPNNDSFNDSLVIDGMNLFPLAKMDIFDRHGKLLYQLGRNNYSWNGNHKGNPLPASDYWYVLKIDNLRPEIKGHFSLVR